MTLPIVGVLSLVLWFVVPETTHLFGLAESYESLDYGLWAYLPECISKGILGKVLGLVVAILCIYFMAELNNENVLLRISSRMLSSMLGILLAISVPCHIFQPGSVVMILVLLSYFPLFITYQNPSPVFTMLFYMHISLASLFFPKLIYIVPVYWILQGYMRAMSLKCFIASLLGMLAPYWFFLGVAIFLGKLQMFSDFLLAFVDFHWVGYSHININTIFLFAFMFLLFVSGTIDFYRSSFLDKTRTRIIYNVVVIHGFALAFFIIVQPQYFSVLFPLFVVDTSIVFGHFISLTYNRFTHIYCIILAVIMLSMVAMRYYV